LFDNRTDVRLSAILRQSFDGVNEDFDSAEEESAASTRRQSPRFGIT
jgi:hypothetical protein